jgi:hypothetical protein
VTIAEIIKSTCDISAVQFIHECLLGASDSKRTKTRPPFSRITFATDKMNANDAFYWSSPSEFTNRKPKYIGLVVWVPYEAYESAVSADAVDPHVGMTHD